ncbi:DUF3800 domain-containing protein [Clostridium perfringens]|uniref:DUF3800 domain-containing protein n=1 Tax=Clostridium perfringens TaxID=1502 RepID=UPI0013E37B64|nr:DUF3800 domain-containing protein [Clostridium perfringens]NGT31329.1 DUF3800 domain-containing protein [Clostridium perfringens]NGU09049.1 DUF3800 domain-containing protein [Clostridium perfringens]
MDDRILFIDESGKTGTQIYSEEWNFSKQPYFALCGVLIFKKDLDTLNKFIGDLRQRYKIQGEIKATKKIVRKNKEDIISELWKKFKELNCDLIIEVVNKKFCISMMITNYCVLPYYDLPQEELVSNEHKLVLRFLASYIYENISDELLGKFVEFFDNNTKDKYKLIDLCKLLIQEINIEAIKEHINETIDSLENNDKYGLKKHNLFPLVDYYKGRASTISVCPQIDSFNNILNRIKNFDRLTIIHDKINDLEEAITDIVNNRISSGVIQFKDSKQLDILQVTDFWCGNINDSIKEILEGKSNINSTIEEIIQTKVNFVSTLDEQSILFPQNIELEQYTNYYKEFIKNT